MRDLVSLAYTSRAAPSLSRIDVDAIHRAALTYNPLDGITGLLVVSHGSFLQIIEGAEDAIDSLMSRLINDRRHCDLVVHDRRPIKQRHFSQWDMRRVDVDPDGGAELAEVRDILAHRLDPDLRRAIEKALVTIAPALAVATDQVSARTGA